MIAAGFLASTKFTNRLYQQAELPFVDLRMEVAQTAYWYFGDLNYRLSPGVWGKGGWRFMTVVCGSFAMVALVAIAFLRETASRLSRCWLLGAALTTLIFFHLVVHHAHYFLMFAPAVAMLLAQVAVELEPALLGLAPGRRLAVRLAMMMGLALATVQGLEGLRVILKFDNYPNAMANLIRQHTVPGNKLLIEGGGWGGQLLSLSDRKGLSIWNTKLLEDEQTYRRLKERGYTKLVMVSESPLLSAIKGTTRPAAAGNRESYRRLTTPGVET